ncbi:MAG: hypothetical protein SFY68_00155 [Candidatus Sumerlaeia bacterium]|nr:hypothetical protein [Candidatus Sumerlaeia bacterium]
MTGDEKVPGKRIVTAFFWVCGTDEWVLPEAENEAMPSPAQALTFGLLLCCLAKPRQGHGGIGIELTGTLGRAKAYQSTRDDTLNNSFLILKRFAAYYTGIERIGVLLLR